jgi:hypothetical protein
MTLSDEPPASDPEGTEVLPERLAPEEVPEPAIEDTPERA